MCASPSPSHCHTRHRPRRLQVLAIALYDSVYLWNASNDSSEELMTTDDDAIVTSLSWAHEGRYMAIGTSDALVQIWDVERLKRVCTLSDHDGRVTCLAWNGPLLSSSGHHTILHHDVRAGDRIVGELQGHNQAVVGLKWSPAGNQLASGGNDDLLNIWDDRYASSSCSFCDMPVHRLEQHQAAVRALAWCPWKRNLLASGGGSDDCMIRFWDSGTGTCINAIDTQAQVCALQWSTRGKQLISSHGFSPASQPILNYRLGHLILWDAQWVAEGPNSGHDSTSHQRGRILAETTGHNARVLHMAQSHDGSSMATAAADDMLHIWKLH